MNTQDFDLYCTPARSALLGFAINLTRNKVDADDLVQETLFRCFKAWGTFAFAPDVTDPEVKHRLVRAWLFFSCRNNFITRCQMSKRRGPLLEQYLAETDAVYEIEDQLVGYSDEVSAALALLPKDTRDIVLRAAAGNSYSEIAAELGIPMGTVMSRLFRGRKALGKVLGDYAAKAYGLGTRPVQKTSSERERFDETAQSPQTEADCIDGIIVRDDESEFFGAEGDFDAVATW